MPRRLSSHLTILFKYIFPALWSMMIMATVIVIYLDSKSLVSLVVLIMILPMLIPMSVQWVSYDEEHVYISNGFSTKVYTLENVRAIHGSNIFSFDPFFQLEIFNQHGFIEKVNFLPRFSEHITFMLTNKFTGSSKDFNNSTFKSRGHNVSTDKFNYLKTFEAEFRVRCRNAKPTTANLKRWCRRA